jgi:C_GCAxxG_C_C family probable redox protein
MPHPPNHDTLKETMMNQEAHKLLQVQGSAEAEVNRISAVPGNNELCFHRRKMLTFLSAFVGTMAVSDVFAAPQEKAAKTKAQAAADIFSSGLQCSQAILAPFAGSYGLDKNLALKLTSGLGGGACSAELCGAVNAAVMVISLKHGYTALDKDRVPEQVCNGKVAEFLGIFKKRYKGQLTCRGLLGCDITTPEGLKQAMDNKLFATVCTDVVASTAAMLEDLGY